MSSIQRAVRVKKGVSFMALTISLEIYRFTVVESTTYHLSTSSISCRRKLQAQHFKSQVAYA